MDKRSKALKGLKCCAEYLCGECPYKEFEHIEYKLRCIHMLINDLEEVNRPMKTIEEKLPQVDESELEHYCPNCEKFLGFKFNYRKKFCSECGQPLKYKEDEEDDTVTNDIPTYS